MAGALFRAQHRHMPALPTAERLPTLDILRGFALMGIFIMNMPGFNTSFFVEADGSHLWPGRVDQGAEWVREALFSGKFNSMFSLLFGIGFTIQFTRMPQREGNHIRTIGSDGAILAADVAHAHHHPG